MKKCRIFEQREGERSWKSSECDCLDFEGATAIFVTPQQIGFLNHFWPLGYHVVSLASFWVIIACIGIPHQFPLQVLFFLFLFFSFFLEKDEILVQNFVRQNGWYLAKIFCISKYLAIYHFFEIRICEIWVWHKTRVLKTQVLKKRPLTWIILIKKMTYGTRVYEARVLCNVLLEFIKLEYHIPHDTHSHTLFALPPSATHPTSHN